MVPYQARGFVLLGIVLVEVISCRNQPNEALLPAARGGNWSIVETLIVQGANINVQDDQGWTALMWASSRGNVEMVDLLLQKGARVDMKSRGGVTALMWGALDGHALVVKRLIAGGADVNARDKNGNTALMAAGHRGHVATVKVLIAHKANIHDRDHHGDTALILAARGDYLDLLEKLPGPPHLIQAARGDIAATVRILLDTGADPHVQGENGKTALMHAVARGETNIVELLKISMAEKKE